MAAGDLFKIQIDGKTFGRQPFVLHGPDVATETSYNKGLIWDLTHSRWAFMAAPALASFFSAMAS